MRPARPFLVALLLGRGSAVELEAPQCDFSVVFSLRSDWDSSDDACHGKLPFDLWTLMKAEGSARDSDAQYARENCLQTQEVELVELITPQGYTMSEGVKAAPGDIISETQHASTYTGATAATFEAFCDDENISQVTRVNAVLETHEPKQKKLGRRLKASLSEAGQAHEVAKLIAGLQDLGCTRTTGEDQTVCVISDSFDQSGNAAALQASGDLPQVEVVKELPTTSRTGIDEGSAMLELMYDIASGSTYKFNTGFLGEQTFADDVYILSGEEGCDIIVDDIGISDDPAFRDGVISVAVDDVVDSGNLYFSSAGNSGVGYRFESSFECANGFQSIFADAPGCGTGVPSHVFQPDATDIRRYFYPYTPSTAEDLLFVHWDADIDTTEDVVLVIYQRNIATGVIRPFVLGDFVSAKAWEAIFLRPGLTEGGSLDPIFEYYLQIVHMGSEASDIDANFLLRRRGGSGIRGESDGSMYGHACASSCVAVGAIDWAGANGPAGAFEDPETSLVEGFSSRGPCFVNGEARSKPTTAAADGLTTSHPRLGTFYGTSAAAPVAAAIVTVVRAACFPTLVGYAEVMDMLTNYDYTIDYTNDADGAAETWGAEAGHGIISAAQMLAWVEANCAAACPGCDPSDPTSCEGEKLCCPQERICKDPDTYAADACGDPHMTGFHGQKFDFTGEDGTWYCLLSDSGAMHVNMRVTAPVSGRPEITYITGVSILTTDSVGLEHSVVITVKDPHSLDSACPTSRDGSIFPCLADGALSIVVDGEDGGLLKPGTAIVGPGVSVDAVNLPGACRSFGFEHYWERKKMEYAQAGRRLTDSQSMSEWILGDPTVTNMEECVEYVARVAAKGSTEGLFNHQSEHVSFRIVTPKATIRLSHGRLHQTATRDPTDSFELPDHLTWQMNVAIDQNDVSLNAKGVLGETIVPRRGPTGELIMEGMEAIRGKESEYRVAGPLEVAFAQGTDQLQR